MLIRIVKMTFHPEKVEEFVKIFDSSSSRIRGFNGCQHLELLRDIRDPNTFFTYSYWNSAEELDVYRQSELFKNVWESTSALFSEKARVWSVKRERNVKL